ncbi:MAG: HlyD family secretion protein [Gemmatirosa sp.]
MDPRRPVVARPLGLAAVLLIAGCRGDASDGALVARGTVEWTQVDVAPLTAGRVTRVLVEEGARVRAGDTLAILEQPALDAMLAQGEARVAASRAQLRELEAGARNAELARAAAELQATSVEATRTAADSTRLAPLAAAGTVSPQQLDAARAQARVAAARRDAAAAALRLLRVGARPERLRAAGAELTGAQAAAAGTQATARDLTLLAPVDGTVLVRAAEPGAVLATGVPALTLGEPRRPWVRVYVASTDLPRVRVGAAAEVRADGTTRAVPGRVVAIRDRAEFTPRVALTEEERADLVFGVKVAIMDTSGALRAGLPVTVTFPAARAP